MIINPRTIDVTTRDVAPQLGDQVQLYQPAKGEPHHSRVTQVLAHLPALGPLGAWEVYIVGINKPERTALVSWAGPPGGKWYELGGR